MPTASVLVPPGLLLAAGLLAWCLGRAGVRRVGLLLAIGTVLALASVLGIWFGAGRAALELSLPGSLAGAPLNLRLDAITAAFGAIVLLPAAILFSVQRRDPDEAAMAALATAASLLAVEAASVLLTAVALSACASLVLVNLRQEEEGPRATYWVSLSLAALLLLWAATVLEVIGGTSVYSAAPVTALRVPVFVLLAAAALLCSGLLPARTWVSEIWARRRLEAGALAVVLLLPIGFLLLTRAYVLGAGQWPAVGLNVALGVVGAGTALAAGLRAQSAASRRGFLAEGIPLSGGLALLSLALGTPFGISTAVLCLAAGATVALLVPLLPASGRPAALLAVALTVGAPPALVFGSRLLALQATIEAGGFASFLALVGAAAWLLAVAGVARLPRLPAEPDSDAHRLGAPAVLGLSLVSGVGLGALETLLALPVAAQAIGSPTPVVSGGYLAVITASGGWPALTLGGPLLLLAGAAAVLSRRVWSRWPAQAPAGHPPPAPLLPALPASGGARLGTGLRRLRLPEQYRSLLDLPSVERAAAAGHAWFWGAVTLALIIAVTR
jgi:hypothetical protein